VKTGTLDCALGKKLTGRKREGKLMAGMLQIITYLLCVHLVYKGWEILQIAMMSARPDRRAGIIGGALAIVVSLALSVSQADS
jgi:hypothetical protein